MERQRLLIPSVRTGIYLAGRGSGNRKTVPTICLSNHDTAYAPKQNLQYSDLPTEYL